MRRLRMLLLIFAGLLVVPAAAIAQGSIAGTVKDTSGAVLPGVTVEASSPVLIEKTRSVISDGTGQYKIVDLRPGIYTVTFTLNGFNTYKREGIEVAGSTIVPVNADLKVGSVAETITVTGETPIVDLQTTTKQAILQKEIVDSLPTGRDQFQVAILIPGMAMGSRQQDVGGTSAGGNANLMIHGARADQQRMTQNGLSTATIAAMGSTSGSVPNMVATQEVTVDVSAASAELSTGGVRLNVIPRDGGNTFRGSVFGAWGNRSLQADNFTDELAKRGLVLHSGHLVKEVYDINPGFGGPIQRDKFWFFTTIRYNVANNYASGNTYFNANVLSTKWTPDLTKGTPELDAVFKNATGRLTYQVSPRNKFAITYDQQARCNCLGGSVTTSPEAATASHYDLQRLVTADWTSPISSRLLLEVVALNRIEGATTLVAYPELQANPVLVNVSDTNGPNGTISYRAPAAIGNRTRLPEWHWRASLSYITGTHTFKVGYNDLHGYTGGPGLVRDWPYRYTISGSSAVTTANPTGAFVPSQLSLSSVSLDDVSRTNLDHDLGLFAQDKWSYKRMVLSLGVRYDYFKTSYPDQFAGSSALAPNRATTLPGVEGNHLHDITPKSGVVFDLFGNGKTALRVTLNKYVEGYGAGGVGNTSPTSLLSNTTNRLWSDKPFTGQTGGILGDFVVQCDLANKLANMECGPDITSTFGGTQTSLNTTDPNVQGGFGHRGYNWEFSGGVTHQLLPRMSIDVGYYRRWYGNLYVTHNLSTTAANYDRYSVIVPTTASLGGVQLPGAGGSVDGYYALNPNSICNGPNGPQPCVLSGSTVSTQNFLTFSDTYGSEKDHWNGVDVTLNARLPWLTVQGGTSTGKAMGDFCEVAAQVPEMLAARNYFGPNGPSAGGGNTAPGAITGAGATPITYCHIEQPWQTQFKGLAIYTVPKILVQVSGTYQNTPGVPIIANVSALASATSLGRNYAAGSATTTVSTNLVMPGTLYGDRLNQLDLRFSKILRFGTTRTSVNVDLYNAFNASTVLTQNNTFAVTTASAPYSAWQTPNSVLTARLLKFSAQFDF